MDKKVRSNPLEKFIKIESFSGLLLLGATLLAVGWANSPWGSSYQALWSYQLGVQISDYQLVKPLILWINDGLMAIFFFLIGLEIKRELLVGELNAPKKAIFPLFAAVGGIAFPALTFFLLNNDPATIDAWAIPMATDIAFSLAILKALGDRVPLNLKIFLTAFAIVDDLGAVLIIAIFYSTGIKWSLILIALALLGFLALLAARQRYSKFALLLVGIAVWTLFLKAGIHPTIAGVLLAFTVPLRQRSRLATALPELENIVSDLQQSKSVKPHLLSKAQIEHLDDLDDWAREVQSPLQQLEHKLHDWVAYLIMPIFALANAGVTINTSASLDMRLILAIALALVVGKAVGIFLLSNLALGTGLAKLPAGLSRAHLLGVSFLAGVGFTMSMFIANLAFLEAAALLDAAKVGILIGSLVAGATGYLILRSANNASMPQ